VSSDNRFHLKCFQISSTTTLKFRPVKGLTLGISSKLVYPEDVSTVPFYHWKEEKSTTDDSGFPIGALYDDHSCSICLNYIYHDENPDKVCTLAQQCGHAFHHCCLVGCLRNRSVCPVCREVVSSIQPFRNNLPENLIVRETPSEHRFRHFYAFVSTNFISCNVFQIKSFNLNKIRCLVSDTQNLALSLLIYVRSDRRLKDFTTYQRSQPFLQN